MTIKPINILTIAGSDSSAGAGIQADMKTIHSLGAYALTAITALTAQNTQGVVGIHGISAAFMSQQLNAIAIDIPIHAIKIGMLFNEEIIASAAEFLSQHPDIPVVLDPVMVATSGDMLLEPEAKTALIDRLFPLATLLTPNFQEASVITNKDDIHEIIDCFKQMNQAVLIKDCEPQSDEAIDCLVNGKNQQQFTCPRTQSRNTHGTGCTLSSAIATYLGYGYPLVEAITEAKRYLSELIKISQDLSLGKGQGPMMHMPLMTKSPLGVNHDLTS